MSPFSDQESCGLLELVIAGGSTEVAVERAVFAADASRAGQQSVADQPDDVWVGS
ncbi:MAG: hypothetical protein WAL64_08275 [Candidatus Dormiibacterota bacterium]